MFARHLVCTVLFFTAFQSFAAEVIKAGIIGADTSHVTAFTELLNSPKAEGDLAGIKVVACYPSFSADIPSSKDRVEGYKTKLTSMGVELVGSIDDLLAKVDVVLLENVDGRTHLQQVIPVLKAKKPVFIDKPVAGTLAEVLEVYRLAAELNVPCFSSSALRFGPGIFGSRTDARVGTVLGCDAYSPCSLEASHPDLFWYGIHGVETLFTIMGPGCESVTRVQTKDTELVVGTWKDGRVGTFRGIREGKKDYGATVFGSKGIIQSGGFEGYKHLVAQIAKFFKTKAVPVSPEETIEIYAFMEAADESKRQGGKPVRLESVLTKARQQKPALKP
ncbi:MAG TPA: Gfo/Idh/MocA family oxidoreductase [Planctomycetota bacterium]|nr:Gfo/Idh/MocA family oxidoreductase [Planctomycetota bacterium]